MIVKIPRQRHVPFSPLLAAWILLVHAAAFRPAQCRSAGRSLFLFGPRHSSIKATSPAYKSPLRLSSEDITDDSSSALPQLKPCYYKRSDGSWKPRKNIESLFIGERLFGTRLSRCDLLNGKTGPKVFFECGIGRVDSRGKWQIANGMMRLGKGNARQKATSKKVKKLPDDSLSEVYVSRVNVSNGAFEVCRSLEDVKKLHATQERMMIPASELEPGEELSGKIVRVYPYGVIVDVGANRNGLLHITNIAKRLNSFIKKEEGLKKAGFDQGVSIRVVVLSNEQKGRLRFVLPEISLDDDGVEEDDDISEEDDDDDVDDPEEITQNDFSEDEAAAWAAYGGNDEENDKRDDEADAWAAYAADEAVGESKRNYDEETDIEDALGIGSY